MHKSLHYLFIASCMLAICSCGNTSDNPGKTASPVPHQDTAAAPPAPEPVKSADAPEKDLTYTAWPVKRSDSLKKAFRALDDAQVKILAAINRADKRHMPGLDTLLVPDKFKELEAYSPFPLRMDMLSKVNKLVLFSYPIQAYAVYEQGTLKTWGPTNMGKKATKTPTGLFFANWKGKEIKSSVNSSWVLKWNFNVHNTQGVGWHQYDLPGYPISHSCMRLLAEDAQWLYDWADQWQLKNGQLVARGTPTVIYGDYPWGQRRPWMSLLENSAANDITVEQLEAVLQPYLEKIMEAQQERADYLRSKEPSETAPAQEVTAS